MEGVDSWNPVILVSPEASTAYTIFNPNDWPEDSKGIIASCAGQFALLAFANATLAAASDSAHQICDERLADLRRQWRLGPWPLSKGRYFVEIPAVHLSIQAFLVTTKTLLDLLAQILSTEGIVHTRLHGFHKKGSIVGGEVLQALAKKRNPNKAATAEAVRAHLLEHKAAWIDQAVGARDSLAHPTRGAPQVMWELDLRAEDNGLVCNRVVPPHVGQEPFDRYADSTHRLMKAFSAEFLAKVRAV